MEYKKVEHIRKRVSLVVQVIDDVTNRTVQGSLIQVELASGEKAVQKEEGYYVFVNVQSASTCLKITSHQFVTYEENIVFDTLNPLEPIVKVRLKPNRFYPFVQKTTCVEGKVRASAQIRILYEDTTEYLRLLQDYRGGTDTQLSIFNPMKLDLEGKSFHITDSETQQNEEFEIRRAEKSKEDCYELVQPMEHSYQKLSSRIYPTVSTKADKEGVFFVTLPFLEKEHTKVKIYITGRKKVLEKELVYGTINNITT